jgi:hypothetical protein
MLDKNKPLPSSSIKPETIAPCGMNCALCYGYIREKVSCPGCLSGDRSKLKSCAQCAINNCEKRKEGHFAFCYECPSYPCYLIKRIDKRYRAKYAMSMMENLEFIKQNGINQFVEKEQRKWVCPNCGKIICVHKSVCYFCGYDWRSSFASTNTQSF